ncbi:MAG TPA: hypothetical protein VGE66_11700 [Chitinophagaceae bacterium]
MKKFLLPCIFILTLTACIDPEPEGNKYFLLLHLEKQELMGTRYLPVTRKDSMFAISDSVAYMLGAANLVSHEKNLQRMKTEGLGVYERVKDFSVTDSAGKDIKPYLKPAYIQRIDRFIENQREEIWKSTIEKE